MATAQEANERGVKFTIEAVAARVGISKKTIYQHFSSKEQLVISVTDAALADVEEQLNEIKQSSMPFAQRLAVTLTVEPRIFGKFNPWLMADLKKHYPGEWEKVKRFRRNKATAIVRLLEEGVKGGHLRAVDTRIAAQMLIGAWSEIYDYSFLPQNNLTMEAAKKTVTDVFLNGVLLREEGGRE